MAEPTFALLVGTMELEAKREISFAEGEAANFLRGQFGKLVRERGGDLYERLFAPPQRRSGPSGLYDAPRPYVVRGEELAGRVFPVGEMIPIRVHLFDEKLGEELSGITWERVSISLEAKPAVQRVRLQLGSPTELKGVEGIEFPALVARLRDRVSTLRQLYGAGPLDGDFGAWVEQADKVRMVHRDLRWVEARRRSRGTGQSHGVGGWVGEMELDGPLGGLLPLLEAGRWTGVGRHTVWGNGALLAEEIK